MIDIEDSLLLKRQIFILDDIEGNITVDAIKKLHYLSSDGTGKPITIFLFSDGGDPECAMGIIDTMVSIRDKNIIRTVAYKARSAAAYILAMGTPNHRYAFTNSIIMMHKTSI